MAYSSGGITSRMNDILRQSQELRERSRDMIAPIPTQVADTNPDRSPMRRSPVPPPPPEKGLAFPGAFYDDAGDVKELVRFHKRMVQEYEEKIVSLEAELHGARNNIKTCEAAHQDVVHQLRTIMEQIKMDGVSHAINTTAAVATHSAETEHLKQELATVNSLNEQLKMTIESKDRLLATLQTERQVGSQQSARESKTLREETRGLKQQVLEAQMCLVAKDKQLTDTIEQSCRETSSLQLRIKSLEEELENVAFAVPASPTPTPTFAPQIAPPLPVEHHQPTKPPPPPAPPAPPSPPEELSYGELQVITMPSSAMPTHCSVSNLSYITIGDHPREVRRALNTIVTACKKVAAQAPILWTGVVGVETKTASREAILLVTDRCVYVVTIAGLVKRCVPLDEVTRVLVGREGVGLVIPSQYDLLVRTGNSEVVDILTQVVSVRRNGAVRYYNEALSSVMELDQGSFRAGALLPVALLFRTKSTSPQMSAADAPQKVLSQKPLPGREYQRAHSPDIPPPPPWSLPESETDRSPTYSSMASPTISTVSPKPRLEPPTVTTEELEGLPPQHTPKEPRPPYKADERQPSPKKKGKPKGYYGATVVVYRPSSKPIFDTINFLGSFTPDIFAEELTKFLTKTQGIMLARGNFNLHLAPRGVTAGAFSAQPLEELLSEQTKLGQNMNSLQSILQEEGREMNSGAKHIIFVMVHKSIL